MNILLQSARTLRAVVKRGIAPQTAIRGNATMKKDDYMRTVKYPALWLYAFYGYLMYCCIQKGREMDAVYEELQINGLPMRDRPRDPDHELLSGYRKFRFE